MEFKESTIEAFESLFSAYQQQIRQQPGCQALELHGDPSHPYVRYTQSRWESEQALNAYRKSILFGEVWPRTKELFVGRPQAFSLFLIRKIP